MIIGPCGVAFCSPWETIQIGANDGAPNYLAHHELFHVLQNRYVSGLMLPRIAANRDPRWFLEASADWAAGYVTQAGTLSQVEAYFRNLPVFVGRPSEELSHFDFPRPIVDSGNMTSRQYGAFIWAEFMVENMDPAGPNPDVIKQTWETIRDNLFVRSTQAMDTVAQSHGTSLATLFPQFARANYFLDYDDSQAGGRASDVAVWRRHIDNGATVHDGFTPSPSPRSAGHRRRADGVRLHPGRLRRRRLHRAAPARREWLGRAHCQW